MRTLQVTPNVAASAIKVANRAIFSRFVGNVAVVELDHLHAAMDRSRPAQRKRACQRFSGTTSLGFLRKKRRKQVELKRVEWPLCESKK